MGFEVFDNYECEGQLEISDCSKNRKLTHLSLFSGIGGLDLAAEWAGFESVGQCEWADYPTKVLEKHWPDVPRWRDIRTLTGDDFYAKTGRRTVDIISGGFPCQPFSVAGKQRGKEDDRYLWPEMVRVIAELRPTWVVGENVAGIVSMALDDVLSDLEREGYAARTFLFPAHAVGAPHRRYRTAIVGYSKHNGLYAAKVCGGIGETGSRKQEREKASGESSGTGESRNMSLMADTYGYRKGNGRKREGIYNKERDSETEECRRNHIKPGIRSNGENVADTDSRTMRNDSENVGTASGKINTPNYSSVSGGDAGTICNAAGQGFPNGTGDPLAGQGAQEPESKRSDSNVSDTNDGGRFVRRDGKLPAAEEVGGQRNHNGGRAPEYVAGEWWAVEPDVGRVANGVPSRVDRLKCLGNAVVPQQFYPVFKAIADIENR